MSWNEIANKGNENTQGAGKIPYVKLKPGITQMRVLDAEPFSRWTHWIPQANGGKGCSVNCIGRGCPICASIKVDKDAKRKSKYSSPKSHAINVLVRSFKATPTSNAEPVNEVQVLDKGNKIFEQMLVSIQQLGDIRNYDITITQTGTDLGSINYTVLPVYPPVALTDAEKALPKHDITAIQKNFTVEQIKALMEGKTLEEITAMVAPETAVDDRSRTNAAVGVDFTREG